MTCEVPRPRVGTVDKFQGQEAAVVLVSMATSSGDDLPRNIEFLYSRNRLNVAISRARCLSVIFANPRLLEIPCSSIEQMELVNGLCWAPVTHPGKSRNVQETAVFRRFLWYKRPATSGQIDPCLTLLG